MAQMVTHASQSEMHIGLNTSAFGAVDVRTVVHASEVGLTVGREKGDLHSLLSNELPTIANSLQQQSLRLTQVNFHHGSGLSGNTSSGGGSPQQRFAPSSAQSATSSSSPDTAEISPSLDNGTTVGRGAGLSILA
jgi:flagellar hook-length control protein FliK